MIPEWMDQYMSMAALNITWSDVVEILILAFIIYHVMIWIKSTRAWSLMKGSAVLFALLILAYEHDTVDRQELLQSWNYGGHCSISAGTSSGSGTAG